MQFCYVAINGNAPGQRIGIVKMHESGYYLTDYDHHETIEECREHVRLINARMGISAEVEESMLAGSMFGWDTPAAHLACAYFAADREGESIRVFAVVKDRRCITACDYEIEAEQLAAGMKGASVVPMVIPPRESPPSPTDRPMAAPGLISYRARGTFGWIMIGARDDADALKQGQRSTEKPLTYADLEVWDADADSYRPVQLPAQQ